MKKKALALAVAGVFFAPASYAAQDNQGMHYTSAAEGFYASIRAVFQTENTKNGGAGIHNGYSRFGVRGSNDLGNGLKGFYQFEANAPIENAGDVTARLGHVGLEGAFGRVWAGSGWVEAHNMVYGVTDVSNYGGGNVNGGGARGGRLNKMLQYKTPDIGGFQGALGIQINAGTDNDKESTSTLSKDLNIPGGSNDPTLDKGADCVVGGAVACSESDAKDDNNVDKWSAAGKYSVQGFTGAFAYEVKPDYVMTAGGKKDDLSSWTARLGYAQDNWHIDGFYGRDNNGDFSAAEDDAKYVSIGAGVSVQKVNLYGIWEQSDSGKAMNPEKAYTILGTQYNLGSRSRVWMEYVGQDIDGDANAEDSINIGLRHDF